LETNILNLLVVIIALGTLIQQYFTSVIKSYEIPLYESVNDLYLLEKEIQAIKDDTITSKAVVIRMYLNALMLSKYSLLEVKALAFIQAECAHQRIIEFERTTTKTLTQELFEEWFTTCFEEVVKEFKKDLLRNPEKHQPLIESRLEYLEQFLLAQSDD
jgi:hypothetical protein